MFQFRPFPSYAYLIQRTMMWYCHIGFPHSEIHGYSGYLLLPVAYRSLSRPSSAPDAKAFPLRSFQLDRRRRGLRIARDRARAIPRSLRRASSSSHKRLRFCARIWDGGTFSLSSPTWFKRLFGSLRIMQAILQDFEIVIVTLHLLRCVPQLKLSFSSELLSERPSVALLITFILRCSVFKVRSRHC